MQQPWAQWVLDHDLTLEDLRQAAELYEKLRTDPEAAEQMQDYERLRGALHVDDAAQPSGGWEAFEHCLAKCQTRPVVWRTPQVSRIARWGLAAAAVVAVALTVWNVNARRTGQPQEANRAALLPADADQQVEAFQRVTQVFDGRTTWVAFSKGDTAMGLAAEPVVSQRAILVLRLTLARRDAILGQTDLAIVPGQTAKVTLPLQNGAAVSYTVGVSDQSPPRLALWAELTRDNGTSETLAALASNLALQQDGVLEAGEMVTSKGSYRLTVGSRVAALEANQP